VSEAEESDELFYRGTLLQFARGTGRGVVRSARTGREVPFELIHVVVLGASAEEPLELREGMEVGYDVGWTSRGLRVTKIFPIRAEGSSGT
jgi:hypothetical protein